MDGDHPYRPTILPVPDGPERPTWSVMIPTYNCADYLREALASVMAQDHGPNIMQIEVIDDHSTKDDPESVVHELGGGRVGFYRQPANVGHVQNFNTCIRRANGRLIHLLHGDDRVCDGFYAALESPFAGHPEVGAAFCRHIYINRDGDTINASPLELPESGIVPNWLEKIACGQRLSAPAMVVRRDVYEHVGGFDRRISCYAEDWEMWVRIAVHYPVWFEIKPLAMYRSNSRGSLTERAIPSGADTRDTLLATKIIRDYLSSYVPGPLARRYTRQARETYASWAIETASEMLDGNDNWAAVVQLREALRCSRSPIVLRQVARLVRRMSGGMVRQRLRGVSQDGKRPVSS